MLEIQCFDPSIYEENKITKTYTGVDYLLETHILPGLGINKDEIEKDAFLKMTVFLNEAIGNGIGACEEKIHRRGILQYLTNYITDKYHYHPSLIIRCKRIGDNVKFILRDNGIGNKAKGTEWKRKNLGPNKGTGEQTMSQIAKNYRRISRKSGSIVRGEIDITDTSGFIIRLRGPHAHELFPF